MSGCPCVLQAPPSVLPAVTAWLLISGQETQHLNLISASYIALQVMPPFPSRTLRALSSELPSLPLEAIPFLPAWFLECDLGLKSSVPCNTHTHTLPLFLCFFSHTLFLFLAWKP